MIVWVCSRGELSVPLASERLAIVPGTAAWPGSIVSPLLSEQIEDLIAMEGQDFVAEVVDQFEQGERHLRRPEPGDLDGNRTQVRGTIFRLAHDLPPRR
jgi:hypothetical protein